MTQQTINIGAAANDGTGDPLRTAMQKVNANFTELYSSATTSSSDTDRRNALLSATYQAALSSAPIDLIDRWADGFASSGGIVSDSSSNYSVSGGALVQAGGTSEISYSAGTVFGSMPNRGAIGNAFDGVTSQTAVNSAGCLSTGGYVGKDWGSGVTKTISRFTIYGPSNTTLTVNNGGNATFVLRGSNTAPASRTDGTALYTLTITGVTGTSQSYDVSSGITATAYRYVWLDCTCTISELAIAEIKFYETASVDMTVVVGSGLSTDAAPSTIRALLDFTPVDTVTLGTDLTVEVSRDGGTTWTAAGSYTTARTIGSRKIVETDAVSVSGQPSGTSVRARLKSLNSKALSVGGVALTWA